MARYMPSAAQLPRVWNEEMDRFICECEAVGDMDSITMIRALKQKFPELHGVVLSAESIERRILMLEQMDNDYFVAGMETAVARAEAAGFTLPPMDLEKYARQPDENEATEVSQDWRFTAYENSNLLNGLTSLLRSLLRPEPIPRPWKRLAKTTSRPEKAPPRYSCLVPTTISL